MTSVFYQKAGTVPLTLATGKNGQRQALRRRFTGYSGTGVKLLWFRLIAALSRGS